MIDVSGMEPGLAHLAIVQKFDRLLPATSFSIYSSNAIRFLYDHLLADRGETFRWQPVKNGPEVWSAKVIKRLQKPEAETIGEIVAKDYRKALIFKKVGIDFCCGGSMTVAEACKQEGLSPAHVLSQLAAETGAVPAMDMRFQNWDIGFMCNYMIQLHHLNIRNNTPFILGLSKKISKSHGEKHPEVIDVADIFENAGRMLMLNISEEEQTIFSYIVALNQAHKTLTSIKEAAFGPVSFPVYHMEAEHEKVTKDFKTLREITKNYELPPYVPPGYGILYKMLQDYEDDLHLHLHLENNILFPKAIEMENEMRRQKFIH